MARLWMTGAVLLVLSACSDEQDIVTYQGAAFRGDLDTTRADRAAFVATGQPASVSLQGAKDAAYYQAVQYCIRYLGTSDIAWANGPDVEDTALVVQDNRVVLTGRCDEP